MKVSFVTALAVLVVSSFSFAYAQEEEQEVRPPLREQSRLGYEEEPPLREQNPPADEDPPVEYEDYEVKPKSGTPPTEKYCPPAASAPTNSVRIMTYEDAKRLIDEQRAREVRRARSSGSPVTANRILRIAVSNHTDAMERLRKGVYRDLQGVKWELRKAREQFNAFKATQEEVNEGVSRRLGIVEDQVLDQNSRLTKLEREFLTRFPQAAPVTDKTRQALSNAEKVLAESKNTNWFLQNISWIAVVSGLVCLACYLLFMKPKRVVVRETDRV